MPPSTTLDLFSAAHRLAECAAGAPTTPEGRDRWFEEVEIHLLAIRALLDVHTDECAADDASRVLLGTPRGWRPCSTGCSATAASS